MSDALAKIRKDMTAAELARRLSALGRPISPQAITQWDVVPPLRVLDVETVTGVSRHKLRPDLYPRARKQPA